MYQDYGLGMGLGPDEQTREQIIKKFPVQQDLPQKFNEMFFQKMLTLLGYDTRFSDNHDASAQEKRAKWTNVYQAFYAHYSRNGQGALWRGKPDQRDQFWAFALVSKYFGKNIKNESKKENGLVDSWGSVPVREFVI